MENHKTKIIAEIAQAHEGSLGILHSYIDAVADVGVDIIKFQTHIAEAESSIHEPFRVNFSYEDKSRYDYWKRMEFSFEQWKEIKAHCDERKIEFMSSPFSCAAVNLLEQLDVKRYKIGSGEVSNLLMLEKISQTGKQILLSSGMSSLNELEQSIEFLDRKNCDIVVFQCTTSYPTPFERVGLNILGELKQKFRKQIGLSDHSGSIWPSISAATLGADFVEVHVTFDKKIFGPDSTSSLTIAELSQVKEGIDAVNQMNSHPVDKNNLSQYLDLKTMFEKSLAVNKNLTVGHTLSFNDLESKKPAGFGIPASKFEDVIGKRITKSLQKYDFLNEENIG